MKERPILFSDSMVRAILAGTKTQTRRVMSEPHRNHFIEGCGDLALCPYGQPGDRLWVRETWRTDAKLNSKAPSEFKGWPVKYGADGAVLKHGSFYGNTDGKTRVSIHMPRWASRLLLEVVSVRVERLNAISEADAKDEGCDPLIWNGFEGTTADLIDWPLKTVDRPYANSYAVLWESINGDGSWAENPWVWVVEFRRIAP